VATLTGAKAQRKDKIRIDVLRSTSLARIPWLVHGFSSRSGGVSKPYGGGSLNLGFNAHDSGSAVERNRRAFIQAVFDESGKPRPASSVPSLVTPRQIHSDIIHCVTEVPRGPFAGDGLITDTSGILLAILTADCFPIIVVDEKHQAVGVFHAGWRGTMKRIVEKGLGEMRRHFGTRPSCVKALIGPGIRGCCYQVGPELKDAFHSQFHYAGELFRETKERDEIHEKYPLLFLTARAPGHSQLPKKIFLDLAEANRRQLLNAGVLAKNISDIGLCTSCHVDTFFSHRHENGVTGRMMAVAGISKKNQRRHGAGL
jgi:YfiH family protein